MHVMQSLILGIPIAIAAGSPVLVERAPTSAFGLFAYGDGIGGAPLFTTGDGAFIGTATHSNDSQAAQVEFIANSDNSLVANPNTTAANDPTWSNLTFSVPNTTSSSHQVGFSNSTSDDNRSGSGFVFYGDFLLHKETSGDLQSMWYAVPSGQDNIWTLNWNYTDDDTDGKVLVTLKTTPPSKAVDDASEA
ncbi:uncharacterized protein F4812DRAFT_454961 [Daldinia caldariorum]|uniref:uncharacterized protein n=1 Tax=Daldinia caldariorum TaxID=326644 RepID=UPI00200765F4|nr:uncharacterized protein F4812DRAFT_454961 [Daldinia caldariorum]KAI1473145.1 hypothetical protein F4812DRAFT_454961 [Daldinia caldariorum]